jgi:hypothetical protein
MPFQVSLCGAYTIISPVTIDIMSTFMSPCVSSLTLTATVVSGNTRGHRFLWELASGSQVIFTSPVDQLVVTCNLTDTTDRIFYFWIDKGKLNQVRQIFQYIGTPTDLIELKGGNATSYYGQNIDAVSCASITGIQAASPIGTVVVNPNNRILGWTLPANTGLQYVEVQQDISGVWTTILSILPTDPQVLPNAIQGQFYRIKTNYLFDRQLYSSYSCPFLMLIDLADYNIYSMDLVTVYGGNATPKLGVVYYTQLSTDSITSEIVDLISLVGGNATSLSVVNYTLLSTDNVTSELVDLISLVGGNATKLTVTYFGGTLIGSSV